MGQAKTVRIELADTGDATTDLRAIYDTEFSSLTRLAQLLVGDRGLAEELVQDAFAQLVERPPRLVDPEKLPAYVRSAVLNASRSKLRRRALERRQARAEYHEQNIPAGIGLPDLALRKALLELPIRQILESGFLWWAGARLLVPKPPTKQESQLQETS